MANAVIGALRVNLSADTAAFAAGLKNAQSRLQGFGKAVRAGFIGIAGAATAVAGGLAVAVREALNTADDMAKAAQKIGIPVEELSGLRHAADLAGVSFGTLQTGVRRFSQNIADAARGVGEGKVAFEALGIEVKNADGTLKTASALIDEVANRFAAMPDGVEKTAAAVELFGRSGAEMIPLLNSGANEIARMRAEAESLGLIITDKTAKAAEGFNDNLTRLGKAFSGVGLQLAAHLAPHLEAFTNWLVENMPNIVDAVSLVADSIAMFIGEVQQVIQAAQDGWAAFRTWWDGMLEWRDGVALALEELRDRALAAIGELVDGVQEWIVGRLGAIWDSVVGKVKWVGDQFKALYENVVGGSYVPDMVDGIAREFQRLDSVMVAPAAKAIDETAGGFRSLRNETESLFEGFGSSIGGAIAGTKSWGDAIRDVLRQLSSSLLSRAFGGQAGGGIFGSLISGFARSFLPEFASGGSFTVGGAGGTDSQLVAFRATPGEMVDVRTPGQAAGGNMVVNIINASGEKVETRETRTAQGGRNLEVMIGKVVAGQIATPGSPVARSLQTVHGLSPNVTRRS